MTAEAFAEYLLSFGVFSEPGEAREYVRYHWARFLRTLEEIPPEGDGPLLEIGAAPFAMTLMLARLRRYDIHVVNYGSPSGALRLASPTHGEVHEFPCAGTNVECDVYPWPDGFFDVVLCAEVIEHLTFFPSWMLYEIHRVLKPRGRLVLTTPNALRLFFRYGDAQNFFAGHHVGDCFSGYGPYGRHNRELAPSELEQLVAGTGFAIERLDLCDVEPPPRSPRDEDYARAIADLFGVDRAQQARWRQGQMILIARPARPRALFTPPELYRSIHALSDAQKRFPLIP